MLESTILSVLALIEGILPLVTGSQNSTTVSAIDNIIDALEKLAPTVITWSENIASSINNIISTLNGSGVLSDSQIAATTALQATVDANWNAVVNQIDPDNPANAGTPAGDDPASTTT